MVMECFMHQVAEEPLYQTLSGYISCLHPVGPAELISVHLQTLCAASRIANFWDRLSMLLPFRYVSVGCKFILLARSVVGTMSRTTLYQADRTVSDTTPPQLSLVQNTVCFVFMHVFVLHTERVFGNLMLLGPEERTNKRLYTIT